MNLSKKFKREHSVFANVVKKTSKCLALKFALPQIFASTVRKPKRFGKPARSEEHTSELQSRVDLVCRLLLEKKKPQKSRAPDRRRARIQHFAARHGRPPRRARPRGPDRRPPPPPRDRPGRGSQCP